MIRNKLLARIAKLNGKNEYAIREAIEELCGLQKHPARVFGLHTFNKVVATYKMLRFMKDRDWPLSPLPIAVWEKSTRAAWPQMAAAVIIFGEVQ